MSRPSAIDAPVELRTLLAADDLEEVVKTFAVHHRVGVAIIDRTGELAAGAGLGVDVDFVRGVPPADGERLPCKEQGTFCWRSPLMHDGEPVAVVAVGPYRAVPDGTAPASHGDAGELPEMSDEEARKLARHVARLVSVLLHHAHARYLTTEMHLAAMNDTFAALEAKNEQLGTAIERMQEFDHLKSNFLATVSHELRTPLTSVIGYSEMLLEGLAGPLNEEQCEYVQTVLAKAEQLLQLITGILDASLMEGGSMRVAHEPVSLPDIIGSVVANLSPQAEKRGIEISTPGNRVPRVLGDSGKVRQILWNLVANAVKFTGDKGAVSVEWTVGPLSPDGGVGRFGAPPSARAETSLGVRISVRDSGIGIPPEKQENIFEPFFQVDSSSTREYGGTGLGLTLAKRYTEAHGGFIWVESELGVGSVFSVSLPVVAEDLAAHLSAAGD